MGLANSVVVATPFNVSLLLMGTSGEVVREDCSYRDLALRATQHETQRYTASPMTILTLFEGVCAFKRCLVVEWIIVVDLQFQFIKRVVGSDLPGVREILINEL